MAVAIGRNAQLGVGKETTFGVAATRTIFVPFTSLNLKHSVERIESKAMRAGQKSLRSEGWVSGRESVSGDIEMEFLNQGMGIFLKSCLGACTTTQPNAGSAPTVYEHKFKEGTLDGRSLTAQLALTDVANTFTDAGIKIASWELTCDTQGFLMFKITVDGVSEATNVAADTASYATNAIPLAFTGGVLKVGGTEVPVTNVSLTGDNALKTDRYFMSATTPQNKREQVEGTDYRTYAGSFNAEWDSTLYARFTGGTTAALTAFFTGPVISGAYAFALEVTYAKVRFDGETPDVPGPDILNMSVPFKALNDGTTDAPVAMVWRTTDATVA